MPSEVFTVVSTGGEVTSSRRHRPPELPCLSSKHTCQSTSHLVSVFWIAKTSISMSVWVSVYVSVFYFYISSWNSTCSFFVSQDSLPIWGHRPVDRPSHSACLTTGRSCPVIRWTPLPTPSLTRSSLTPRSVRGWRRPCPTLLTTWTRCNRSNARKRTKKLKLIFVYLYIRFSVRSTNPAHYIIGVRFQMSFGEII